MDRVKRLFGFIDETFLYFSDKVEKSKLPEIKEFIEKAKSFLREDGIITSPAY